MSDNYSMNKSSVNINRGHSSISNLNENIHLNNECQASSITEFINRSDSPEHTGSGLKENRLTVSEPQWIVHDFKLRTRSLRQRIVYTNMHQVLVNHLSLSSFIAHPYPSP